MLKQTLILAVLVLTSCGQEKKPNKQVESNTKTEQETVVTTEDKVANALAFINGYNENSNKMNDAVGMIEWVNSSDLTTKSFKVELQRIIDEAFKEDPELGLDADPILDAQDNPSEGFELESFDEKTNYLIVRGKDWPEFKVTMKVREENGEWLVEGCGIVNVPEGERAKR